MDSLNYAHFHGELSHSQKQAVITLIEKKDKDRRWIKNWRPISLVNVDVKIGSKAIAKRLENVLPHIINYDQNAFVKGRTIFDATRTISDVLEFTKMPNHQCIMTAIDFEKAFDSLNWNFLHKSLEFFGFGESFLGWIKTFYNNISSCVINNGFSTPTFNVKRGVRQGDPLSPSLFIIVLELLALSIRNNDQIKGIAVDGPETGRYDKISRCDRICPVCGLNIEDEIHFLFHCPKYSSIRDDFFNKIDNRIPNYKHIPISTLIIQLMNATDYYLNKQLVQYVSSCLEMRDNLLSKV